MASKYTDFTVIQDTREQKPWLFQEEEKKSGKFRLAETKIQKLDQGDYSIEGFESQFVIEKKVGFVELAGNLFGKTNRERFYREMERLRDIPHKWILIEGNLELDKMKMGIPRAPKAPPFSFVLKQLFYIQMEYGVPFLFVGDTGPETARRLMEEFLRRELL